MGRWINSIIDEHTQMTSLLEQIRMYHELSKKGDLSASEELKLTIAKQTMQQNGILTIADEIRLRDRAENMGKRIAALKEKLEDCKMTYDVYVDIASTYREISAADYLAKLEEEERQRREREAKKHKKKL